MKHLMVSIMPKKFYFCWIHVKQQWPQKIIIIVQIPDFGGAAMQN